jgi:hypothetical protein
LDIETNIDTSFLTRRRERQIKFERSVLRELSLAVLKKSVQNYFAGLLTNSGLLFDQVIEEGCYDVALEVYLLGSSYSRLGYYGKPIEEVKASSLEERRNFSKALQDFIAYWGAKLDEQNEPRLESQCDAFVDHWFMEGFMKGKMKYKMRLH